MSDKTELEKQMEKQMAHYHEMVEKLYVLSKISSMKFNGPHEGAPAEFIITLEIFKNLANYQLAVLNRLVTKLGVSGEDFLAISCDELGKHLKNMEDGLAVKGWGDAGPIFDLAKYQEKTRGWPK